MEYLLLHDKPKVLSMMVLMGRSPFPAGIMAVVLRFFGELFKSLNQEVLAHHNVFTPLKELLRACRDVVKRKSGPEHAGFHDALADLLLSITIKIQETPLFADLFIEKSDFLILSAATAMLPIANGEVQEKVRTVVKICLRTESKSIMEVVTVEGNVCTQIAHQLMQLYGRRFKPDFVPTVYRSWQRHCLRASLTLSPCTVQGHMLGGG
jgi:hypothetical protein